MRNYPQRVKDNILPFSVADSLPEAFDEWSFTENTIDHGEPIETCKLCEHEQLRYHFEIKNENTHKTLWVGSQCILKFNVSVFEDGARLSAAEAKKKLDRLMQQMRLESCLAALEKAAMSEENPILRNALTYYKKNQYLTPKQAFVVLWRLQANKIDHSASFFKINLKKAQFREDLGKMPTSKVHMIWPALTAAQRKLAIEMGHSAPE